MSDALSDIARDEERGRHFEEYLEAVKVFLKDPSEKNKRAVVKAAEMTDGVRRGYFSGGTNLAASAEEMVTKLHAGDKDAWAKLLFPLRDSGRNFEELKKLSPFAEKLLIKVDYGCGFVRIEGEIESFVASLIRDGKGWKVYDADDYLVVVDKPKNGEVFWVGGGNIGATGPRKVGED